MKAGEKHNKKVDFSSVCSEIDSENSDARSCSL